MRIKDYIQAAYETLKAGTDIESVLARLRAYLAERGLLSLYPRILRGLAERLNQSAEMETGRLIVAREQDAAQALTGSKEHAATFGTISKDDVRIDPTIIGGFILERGGVRLDQSHKRALLDAYQRLTS